MEDKKTIFDYLSQVFCIFGIAITVLNIFCLLFGESAKGFSFMFALGSNGLTVKTMLQFLLVSAFITGAMYLYFTDCILKNASIVIRTALMLITDIVIIALFIYFCDWFPVNMWIPWVMFFICFGVSFGISTAVIYLKEKVENKNMDKALKELKTGMK